MKNLPTTSVIVPTYNRHELLGKCLQSLAEQTMLPTEVIVVDDASDRRTSRVVEHLVRSWPTGSCVRLICLPTNSGPASARNVGVDAAIGEFVAFTDDDCMAAPRWLNTLCDALVSAPNEYAGVGGRVLSTSPGIIGDYMVFHRILEPPSSCSYLVTANCIYRRSVVIEAGGFDAGIRHPGGEDPGLSLAITRMGYRLGYAEDAVVHHHFRESFIDFARTFFRYGQGCHHVMG